MSAEEPLPAMMSNYAFSKQRSAAAMTSLEQKVALAKAMLPEYDRILGEMEYRGGWLDFGEPLSTNLIALKIRWWDAYSDERRARLYQALTFFTVEELKEIAASAEAAADAQRYLDDFCAEYQDGLMDRLRAVPDEEWLQQKRDTEAWLAQATEQEAAEYWSAVRYYWLGFMPTFHNTLSVLIHGKGLYRLVAEASDGISESFFKAVQIDRTVLFLEPFRFRIVRAQLTNDQAFLRDLSYRLQNPITKSKLRRRKLWLLFAMLDSEDLLEPLDGRRLLEVCQAVGCYGDEYGNSDEKSLMKRRREYFQNRGPSKYF